MDMVEDLHKELESCAAGINAAGLGNLDPQHIERLDSISARANDLGLHEGKKLIDNLSAALQSCKDGKSTEESAALRLTALEFYLKNTQSAGTEEL